MNQKAPDQGKTSNSRLPRTQKDCWTCRARGTRCDQRQGKCASCSSLRLKCAGYGRKPEWMDGGIQEQQRVDELERQIIRRRRLASDTPHSPRRLPSSRPRLATMPTLSMMTSAIARSPAQYTEDFNRALQLSTPDIGASFLPTPPKIGESSFSGSRDLLFETLQPIADFNSQAHTVEMSSVDHAQYVDGAGNNDFAFGQDICLFSPTKPNPSASPNHASIQEVTSSTGVSPTQRQAAPLVCSDDTFHIEDFLVGDEAPTKDCSGEKSIVIHAGQSQDMLDDALGIFQLETLYADLDKVDSGVSIMSSSEDSTSLREVLYFNDTLMPERFPYMTNTTRDAIRERILRPDAAIKDLLDKSTLAYIDYVQTRGLERYTRGSARSRRNLKTKLIVENATSLLPALNQDAIPKSCLEEIFIVFFQVALLEVRHLVAVSIFTTNLVRQAEEGSWTTGRLQVIAEFIRQNSIQLDDNTNPLTRLLLGFLAIVDIVASACDVQSHSSSAPLDDSWLENPDLAQMTGCQPWVFQFISEVTGLRRWKEDLIASQPLDAQELSERTSKLLGEIQRRRAHDVTSIDIECGEEEVRHSTEVWCYAVELFLHITASPALPDVPDVRLCVIKIISAVRHLSHVRQLRRLSWPICIAASMATREDDAFFAALEDGARGDHDNCLSLLRALDVARECQRLRRVADNQSRYDEKRSFEHIEAMRSLRKEWVLL
ncbi:hypothetical protein M409DRAFT_54166 [Zasmidium cellare ATCC 36951]|uniref:Zn(2)-C6 fungal-type domain-containing protein n=1 Tax=Zasmidium cellare ATCC 36951 TaxID=1080233 RepID=A0A6A6CK24_ZASCE|nr:uncharacterized protein M409DRAFT_54166 [Zasmidium cellare ATCC 36951]KAF2167574.1 hypothetical protein M409DRAFT_54166 [Zasmidium cellare ATCC 36951]